MKCNVPTNVVAIFRKVVTGAAQMDFSTTISIVVVLQDFIGLFAPLALHFGVSHLLVCVVSFLSFSRIANYFDHRKCPRVLAGHATFHFASTDGEIITLASDEMATQVDFLFLLILGSLEDSEDFFGQLWVTLFQFRMWLGHELISFTIFESWVLSDLVPWMLLVRMVELDVFGQIIGVFSHVTTLTAHEAATNVLALSFDKFGLFLPVAFFAPVLAGQPGVELLAPSSSLASVRPMRAIWTTEDLDSCPLRRATTAPSDLPVHLSHRSSSGIVSIAALEHRVISN